MKDTPENQRLDYLLRSSKLVAGGFMGTDTRPVEQIIADDAAKLGRLKVTRSQLAERMKEITIAAAAGLGTNVDIDEKLTAYVIEVKGKTICPWPHPGSWVKRITIVTNKENNKTIRWASLNIHLIEEHGFFEGKGSNFRIEPQELINVIL